MNELDRILPNIHSRAGDLDRSGNWPEQDLRDLAALGANRWFVRQQFGGDGVDPLELHLRYEAIASASVSVALILSQRDSAVGFIEGGENSALREELLPQLARGEFFSTIGIAQLTTSRQGGLRATSHGDGYRLNGLIPWSTGAAVAKYVVAGAVTDDQRQMLFVLPTGLSGVQVKPPLELVALRSTWTSQIELNDVHLESRWILRGPMEKVLSRSSKGLPLGQIFLAFGLCKGALELIQEEGSERARSLHEKFAYQLGSIRGEVLELCKPGNEAAAGAAAPRVRASCHDLAIRITQSTVALYKGSALLMDHPAQRLAREAMFFLVWSCPDPVIDCTVNVLSEG
jgi:alkylation response protein AidB-like acyl-CoA dehydrogenase